MSFSDNTRRPYGFDGMVYFWPDLAQSFREVYRVLKPDGTFFMKLTKPE